MSSECGYCHGTMVPFWTKSRCVNGDPDLISGESAEGEQYRISRGSDASERTSSSSPGSTDSKSRQRASASANPAISTGISCVSPWGLSMSVVLVPQYEWE